MWTWLKDKWGSFEAWVASWMPGLKTKVVAGLGVIGSLAAALSEYFAGLPLSNYLTGTEISMISAGLFTLTFWFRGIGERVSARISGTTS